MHTRVGDPGANQRDSIAAAVSIHAVTWGRRAIALTWAPFRPLPSAVVPRISVRTAVVEDAEAIRAIYNHEVTATTSTFDLVPRSLGDQQRWLEARAGAFAAIVAVDETVPGSPIAGFASLSPYKDRAAYSTTVEDSVYVDRRSSGRGVGTLLLNRLVDIARESGFHAVMARIEASGAASRALHAKCGFELVGIERQVGRKFNRWLDVAVMQRLL
jgi:L-amino acid N-acyltransferase